MALFQGSGLNKIAEGGKPTGAMMLISTIDVSGTTLIDLSKIVSSEYDDYFIFGSGLGTTTSISPRMYVVKDGLNQSTGYNWLRRGASFVNNGSYFDDLTQLYSGSSGGFSIQLTNANSRYFVLDSRGYNNAIIAGQSTSAGNLEGLRIYSTGGEYTNGTVKVYGIKK